MKSAVMDTRTEQSEDLDLSQYTSVDIFEDSNWARQESHRHSSRYYAQLTEAIASPGRNVFMGYWKGTNYTDKVHLSDLLDQPNELSVGSRIQLKSPYEEQIAALDQNLSVALRNYIGHSAFISHIGDTHDWIQFDSLKRAYRHRVTYLREEAAIENIDINHASERDFWSFADSHPFQKRASLVLCDNGNLKAVWKDAEASHLGIQFLGNGQGEYVIFKYRQGASEISRVAGIDTIPGINDQLSAFDLRTLVNG